MPTDLLTLGGRQTDLLSMALLLGDQACGSWNINMRGGRSILEDSRRPSPSHITSNLVLVMLRYKLLSMSCGRWSSKTSYRYHLSSQACFEPLGIYPKSLVGSS